MGLRRLSIVIPCYNEERTVAAVLSRLAEVPLGVETEVVIVDDGSKDGTWDVVQQEAATRAGWKAIRHDRNQGKGAAVRTGIAATSGDVVLVQDADLEYDPSEIPALLAAYADHGGAAIYGSRGLSGKNRYSSRLFYYGGLATTYFANALYGLRLTDLNTCYKLLPADALRQMELRATRFEFDPEVTAKLARSGVPIREIPISYQARSVAEGKKIRARDGAESFWTLLRYRFWRPPHYWNAFDRLLRRLRTDAVVRLVEDGDVVLDVGCGSDGYLRHRLAGKKVRYTGIDPHLAGHVDTGEGMVAGAIGGADDALPFADGAFTKVIALAALEHFAHPDAFFREACRVLAPGGRLLLTTPTKAAQPVLEALAAFRFINKAEIEEHKRYFGGEEIATLGRAAGFTEGDCSTFEFGFNTLFVARKPGA